MTKLYDKNKMNAYVCDNCKNIMLQEDMDGECDDCGFMGTMKEYEFILDKEVNELTDVN